MDDLKSIGALEEYISRSQVVLFFLSLGYFGSKNCEREVRASLDRQKPLVLVQEADPTKGGGTMEELREDCPETLQRSIFERHRPHAVWMRAEEFQRVSLKIIAEAPQAAATAEPASPPHPALMP